MDGEPRNMQFGVQFFPAVNPTEKGASDYFPESLAIAEEAEQFGFTHARTVEHYFERYGGYSTNPIVFLAAVSQRTKTMRLVTGAVLPVVFPVRDQPSGRPCPPCEVILGVYGDAPGRDAGASTVTHHRWSAVAGSGQRGRRV